MRTHEKSLANALQPRRQTAKHIHTASPSTLEGVTARNAPFSPILPSSPLPVSASSTIAAAFSLPSLSFSSQNVKPAKLSLTPHHLYYLLSRFEDLRLDVGPMNVRLENIHADPAPSNYVSFLKSSQRSKSRQSDRESIHSVASVRSVVSGMTNLWNNLGLGSSSGRSDARKEKEKTRLEIDLKYLYSAFTKIPCLRLAPDRKARLIKGFEEFPFDTAVPLNVFKNVRALEISDLDVRLFYGWDKMAEQLQSLSVKRSGLEDPTDLLINLVLDDMEKRRRRSSKNPHNYSYTQPRSATVPNLRTNFSVSRPISAPGSPDIVRSFSKSLPINLLDPADPAKPITGFPAEQQSGDARPDGLTTYRNSSPMRPATARANPAFIKTHRKTRSGSGGSSSDSSLRSGGAFGSTSNLLMPGILPSSKWRFLRHLCLADNSITVLSPECLAPLADTLYSLDLSLNHLNPVPECLASLSALKALNLSSCMIESLLSLQYHPLPAITALNLRANRLSTIIGIEKLLSLERLDLRENLLKDPAEITRLTGAPAIRELWVSGNPMVKTHSNYRISIFNLFRRAPGHREDPAIDNAAPSFTERKQLVERTVEQRASDVATPAPLELPSVIAARRSPRSELHSPLPSEKMVDYAQLLQQKPLPASPLAEEILRKPKIMGPKRRIVDLSKDEPPPSAIRTENIVLIPENASSQSPTVQLTSPHPEPTNNLQGPQQPGIPVIELPSPRSPISPRTQSPSAANPPPRIITSLSNHYRFPSKSSATPLSAMIPVKEGTDWGSISDSYRKRMEAQKTRGETWLNTLSEEGLYSPDSAISSATTLRPSPLTPRANQLSARTPVSGGSTAHKRAMSPYEDRGKSPLSAVMKSEDGMGRSPLRTNITVPDTIAEASPQQTPV